MNKNPIKILNININNLTLSERRIVNFINDNYKIFIGLSIHEASKMVYVSPATLSRFTKKINFNSYKTLQIYLSERQQIIANQYLLEKPDSIQKVVHNTKTYYDFALNETLAKINFQAISELCDSIVKAHTIIIYGVGSSALPAQELANNLNKFDIHCTFSADAHVQILNISKLKEKDLIILISKSFETKEIMALINTLQNENKNIAVITANRTIDTTDFKHVIFFETIRQLNRTAALSSRVSEFFIVDIIFNYISKILKSNSDINDYAKRLIDKYNSK